MEENKFANIISTGSYLPERKIKNKELEKTTRFSAEFIEERFGIKERRFISHEEDLVSLGVNAALEALKEFSDLKIDYIIFLINTPPKEGWYNIAGRLQYELKRRGMNVDGSEFINMPGGCSEYLDALEISASLIESGRKNNILVITSADNSRFLDPNRIESVIFGDGASATLISTFDKPGFLRFYGKGEGKGWNKSFIAPKNDYFHWYIQHDGKAILNFAIPAIKDSLEGLVKENNIEIKDIDKFIFHQVNKRIIERVIKDSNIPEEKLYCTIEKYGNTSISSIGITLDEAIKNNFIKKGDKIALAGFGAGLRYKAGLFIYN